MNNVSVSAPSAAHFSSTPAPALHALLERSIDYAGLFPPAELALESALKNHAEYLRSGESWMLNTFVLPVGRFPTARPHFGLFDEQHPLRISALAARGDTAADSRKKLSGVVEAIRQLKSPPISVVQLEIALPIDRDLHLLAALHEAAAELDFRVFCETPPAEAEQTIATLAEFNTSRDALLGYKLRTGGVTADAFPSSAEIARALVAAVRDNVPIKFTAGLHHPVRQFRDEVRAKMHGFLNVLGAGVFAAEHGWDEATATAMLEDEQIASFKFDRDWFAWREWKINAAAIQTRRDLVTSFGSCSFDEPREDLRSLGLL